MNLTVVVLAAAPGPRMISDMPTAMHAIAGKPMVAHVVDVARHLAPAELVVVAASKAAAQVRHAVGRSTFVFQTEWRGTAHALQQAAPAAAGRAGMVLVLSADRPLLRPERLQEVVEHHRASRATLTLLTFWPLDPRGYSHVLREDRAVKAVRPDADATPEKRRLAEAGAGVLLFQDAWLWPNLDEMQQRLDAGRPLTDLVATAAAQGERIEAIPISHPLEGLLVDDRGRLAAAEAEMRRRINERWMLAGVTLVDPAATYVDAGVEIGAETTLWPNTLLQGQTRIGAGCTIGPGSVIRNATIGDRCRVELSVVEGAIMEQGSNIGPFGHLRKGAHLGPGVHMGNFGEVKNSYLGPGVKMGHMSYLGDATVGADANIGAGTITCNFDGERKHRTVIGAGAFIGSDTMLVAPVEIGGGARTGAGSVVTRDVPPGGVAYGVPARLNSARSRAPSRGTSDEPAAAAAAGEVE